MSTSQTMVVGDFLYHSVHGLCRIDEVTKKKSSGKEVISYELVPKVVNYGNARFCFEKQALAETGFHPLLSEKEAESILTYFKKGDFTASGEPATRNFAAENQPWELAKVILTCAREGVEAKDQRKRRNLERAAKGLILELAAVFQVPVKEAITQVRKNLEHAGKIDPLVVTAITSAGQD
jgi:RNA polymerase-interacting CarD/CdnL/TRCF family regulator